MLGHKTDSMYDDIAGINMVEISEIEPVTFTKILKVDVEMSTEGHNCVDVMVTEDQYVEKIKLVFPKANENLIDFLNRCKIYGSPIMLCPRCSVAFDKKATENVECFQPHSKRKQKWADKRHKFSLVKRGVLHKDSPPNGNQKRGQVKTFTPPSKSPYIYDIVVKSSTKKDN